MSETLEPKVVISPDQLDEVKPRARKKIFRFEKQQAAAEWVSLGGGKEIQFHLKKIAKHGFASISTFETDDEDLAKEIRAAAKNPQYSIVEVK